MKRKNYLWTMLMLPVQVNVWKRVFKKSIILRSVPPRFLYLFKHKWQFKMSMLNELTYLEAAVSTKCSLYVIAYTCNDMMPSFYLKCHHWDMKSRLPTDCIYKWKLYSYFIQRIRLMAQNLILAVKYTLWKNMNIQLTFVVELELWSQFTKASLRGSKTAYL